MFASATIASSHIQILLLSGLLAVVAYLPCVDNGFIADDWVILAQVEELKQNPLFLVEVPPLVFRSTSYLAFLALKELTGYQAGVFYAFSISLHVINVWLLWFLLMMLSGEKSLAALGSVFFAVFQAPQEAVMWLAAMNESLAALFSLATLILWLKKRYYAAAIALTLSVFSKESAIILLLLVPLTEICHGGPVSSLRKYAILLIPTALFAGVFLYTWSANFMVVNQSYILGPGAAAVLAMSLHRLAWPWLYVLIVLFRTTLRKWPPREHLAMAGLCMIPMMPYMFIAYQDHLPSRQVYMASAVFVTMLAVLILPLNRSRWFWAFIVAFVGFNVAYLWLRKDAQFEERSAPTARLVEVLEKRQPAKTLILGFPYPYPEIASAAAQSVPGWGQDLIVVGDSEAVCGECERLQWNPDLQRYE